MQHLTRAKEKSNKALVRFQSRGKETKLITQTIAAFEVVSEHETKHLIELESESKQAQYLAKHIEELLEDCGERKRYSFQK